MAYALINKNVVLMSFWSADRDNGGCKDKVDPTCSGVEDRYRYFVNVGTTGLPFPGKGGPSVALVDLARGIVRQIAL